MQLKSFIENISLINEEAKAMLKSAYKDELTSEATDELKAWVCEDIEAEWSQWCMNNL